MLILMLNIWSYSLGFGLDLELVDADVVVGPAGVEQATGLVPCEGSATELLLRLEVNIVGVDGDGVDFEDGLVGGEIQDLDTLLGTDDEPVELLGEEDDVDGGVAVNLGEELAVDQVPDHNGTVTGAGGKVGGVLDHVDGVDLSLVAGEGVHQLHVHVVPNLDGLVPGGGDDDGGLLAVVELDAGDGIGVLVLVNGVLAETLGVPDLNLVIKTTGQDLSIVVGDGDGEDVLLVADELLNGFAGLHVPETDGTIPGGGDNEAGVAGQANLGNEVGVTRVHLLGFSPLSVLIIVLLLVKFPLDEGTVTGAGDKELLAGLLTDGEGGDPATVGLKETFVFESVGNFSNHFGMLENK